MFRQMGGQVGMEATMDTVVDTTNQGMHVAHDGTYKRPLVNDEFVIRYVDGNLVITPPHDGCRLSFIDGGLKLLRGGEE